MKRPLIEIALTTLVIAIAAFFAGRHSISMPAHSHSDDVPRSRWSSSRQSPSSRTSANFARSPRRETSSSPAGNHSPKPSDHALDILHQPDVLARSHAWLDFLDTLDAAQFRQIVSELRDSGAFEKTEMEQLLAAWAKVSPAEAVDYGGTLQGDRYRKVALVSWAVYDPDGALAWAHEKLKDNYYNPLMLVAIEGVAINDPVRATRLLEKTTAPHGCRDALNVIITQMMAKGDDSAKAWLASITNKELRDDAAGLLSRKLAKQDPAGAARLLASSDHPGGTEAMEDVLYFWAVKDSAAATSYLESMPAGELHGGALRGILRRLSCIDPHTAAKLMDAHPSELNDQSCRDFIDTVSSSDPELALRQVRHISHESLRTSGYKDILKQWLRDDFTAASAWINRNSLPAEVSEQVNDLIREAQETSSEEP